MLVYPEVAVSGEGGESVLITVAICSLNHAESLRRTLRSLVGMRVPADFDWELVVVNNNCIDHTDEVISAFADQLPIRREFEPQRGLSRARNRAVDAAKGDYIVWTDDDVIVDPGWLAAYVEAFRRWPEAAVFGGRIIPRYEEPVVKWMSEVETLIGGAHARRDDLGDYGLPLSVAENRVPYGANFAVRITEQRAFRYNSELGAGPDQHRVAEEIDLIERIMQSGASGYWVPTARIDHCIGRERQTTRYIARHFAACGESDAFRTRETAASGLLFGAPRRLWVRLGGKWLLYHVHRRISPAPVWVVHLTGYALAWGTIRYWRDRAPAVAVTGFPRK
jgi:glycosyltransferase involved in cell wall biosynthesis